MTTMLTSRTVGNSMTATMDTIPLNLVFSDDGVTLLAVTETGEGTIELMSTPLALINDTNDISVASKTTNDNLESNIPLLQVNLGGISGSRTQQATLIPANMISLISNDSIAIPATTTNEDQSAVTYQISQYQPIRAKSDKSSNEFTYFESSLLTPVVSPQSKTSSSQLKSPKRSPGRPKKNENFLRKINLKCEICGEEFKKQSLYRKHMEHHAEEKPHRCPKCPASFNVPTNFTLHMATHNIGEPKCPECGKKFARMASLKSHMMLHEREENLFCTECEDAFSTKAQLDAHLKLHNEKWTTEDVRKCKLCHKQFSQPALYRQHIREHYRLQTKLVKQTKRGSRHKTMYKCKICLKSFQKPSQLMRHIRVHTGEKPFRCTVCSRRFTQKGSLQIHISQHDGLRPHACHFCSARFSQKGNLNAHIHRVHNLSNEGQIYACTYCCCVFKKLGSLNAHLKRRHAIPIEDENPKCDSSTSDADMQATVENVMSQLASLESEVHHQADSTEKDNNDILQQALQNSGLPSKEKEAEAAKKSKGRTMKVTLLDRNSDGDARKFVTITQRQVGDMLWFTCTFCQKEFKKPSDLIRHLRIHTQEKPFKCSYCSRTFALKSTMVGHERTHSATKKFPCGSCENVFSSRSSLTAHARLHTRAFTCNICKKCFSGNSLLKNHMKCHSKPKTKISPEVESLVPQIVLKEPLLISDAGNKISVAHVKSKKQEVYEGGGSARPHKCTMCSAAFRKTSHLKQHHRRHTGEKPYKCPTCDRRFTSNSVLKSHLHTHEDARPHSCSVCNAKFTTHSSMKRHLITHSNKRPFMCPYCHKTFKTSVNCKKHMKIHKPELALQQVEKQKMQSKVIMPVNNSKESPENKKDDSVPETLTLGDEITVPLQPQPVDLTENFSDQYQAIAVQDKDIIHIPISVAESIMHQNVLNVNNVNLGVTKTLHADETGTITLPNYSGEHTLSAESIREIEETLNQQLFSSGMNFGLENPISKQIPEINSSLDLRNQPVINIIYDSDKALDSVTNNEINTHIFTPQFDTFDMSQIALQANGDLDVEIETGKTTSMANILPRSVQEEQHLSIPVTTGSVEMTQKSLKHLMVVSPMQTRPELSRSVQVCKKYSKIIAKADTTNATEVQTLENNFEVEERNLSISGDTDFRYRFSCTICNKLFEKELDLIYHVEEHITSAAKATEHKNDSIEATALLQTNSPAKDPELNQKDLIESKPLLQCHMCRKNGFAASELKEHLKTHQGEKEFQCMECSLKFCTNGGLSRHLKMHAAKQQYKCIICDKVLPNKVQMEVHLRGHNELLTGVVEADSSEKESLPLEIKFQEASNDKNLENTDVKISEQILLDTAEIMEKLKLQNLEGKEEKKPWKNKCKFCPKTFRKPSDLTRHIRTHTGERPYQCQFCSKSFAVKCTLDSHMQIHSGKKTFNCHVCNCFFATKGSLKVHMRLHTGSKPFRCPVCDMRFRTSGHRKVHLLSHVREQKENKSRKPKQKKIAAIASVVADVENAIESITNETPVQDALQEEIELSNIDTVTIDASALTDQITINSDGTVLNNNALLSISESNQLVANLHFLLANGLMTIHSDGFVAFQDSDLPEIPDVQLETSQGDVLESTESENIIISQEPNSVDLEGTGFLNNCTPVLQVQGNSMISNFNVANSSISNSNTLEDPIISNSGIANFNIPNSTAFKNPKSGPSRRECDICGKVFMKPCQVERHKRIHTGERPFKCELCDKAFSQKNTLLMHQKHHTGDRPHNCPYCTFSFSQKGNLQTHLKRVHQKEALEAKKLWKEQPSKFTQESTVDTRILGLDDISFVELLK